MCHRTITQLRCHHTLKHIKRCDDASCRTLYTSRHTLNDICAPCHRSRQHYLSTAIHRRSSVSYPRSGPIQALLSAAASILPFTSVSTPADEPCHGDHHEEDSEFLARHGLPPTYWFDLHILSVRGLLDPALDFSAVQFPLRRGFGSVVGRDPREGIQRVEEPDAEGDDDEEEVEEDDDEGGGQGDGSEEEDEGEGELEQEESEDEDEPVHLALSEHESSHIAPEDEPAHLALSDDESDVDFTLRSAIRPELEPVAWTGETSTCGERQQRWGEDKRQQEETWKLGKKRASGVKSEGDDDSEEEEPRRKRRAVGGGERLPPLCPESFLLVRLICLIRLHSLVLPRSKGSTV